MKKISAFVLIMLLVFSIAACSKDNFGSSSLITENESKTTQGSESSEPSWWWIQDEQEMEGANSGNSGNSIIGTQPTGSSTATEVDLTCKGDKPHTDKNNDGKCDKCKISVVVNFDFFVINDLHGKFKDTDSQIGVNELTTYLKTAKKSNSNTILLSSGDMWQGSSESNLTQGNIITEWMNELGFSSMTLGNHEYDWGEDAIKSNVKLANFPLLAINVYNKQTNKRVDYAQPSVLVNKNGIKIGIIGAMGDCYTSIASDKTKDIYFQTGSQLTSLVKAESERLRKQGADFIVYSIHDGYGGTNYGNTISDSLLAPYYDSALSNGYVDVVFEAHTHKYYVKQDKYGVYHLQDGGDNVGISHLDVDINYANDSFKVTNAEFVPARNYADLSPDSLVDTLLKKYKDEISPAEEVLGYNASYRTGDNLRNIIARLYYEEGEKKWGKDYDIVLGGGFLSVRAPGKLYAGNVTYGDLQMIFPFDNPLVLCSVKGRDLKNKFFETKNKNYFIHYDSYGERVKNNIDLNATYYIIVDSYTSTYAPNNLTEIARLDDVTYARDLLAKYIKAGGMK